MPTLEPGEETIFVETTRHKDVFGNLFLTSKRLIFEHSSGLFSKGVYITLDLPLEGVVNVSVEGTFIKKLVVSAKKGFVSNFPVRLDFLVKEPTRWQNRIISALKARMQSIEAEKKKERVHIMIDFSFLKDYMKQGGLIMQTFKCPTCGASLNFPGSGNTTTCKYCNSNIKAEDIFEKIKSLI